MNPVVLRFLFTLFFRRAFSDDLIDCIDLEFSYIYYYESKMPTTATAVVVGVGAVLCSP